VRCSGRTNQRLYIVQRDVKGKSRRITLGTVSGLKLDAARVRAEDALDDLRRGIDPKQKAKAYTLQEAVDEFLGPEGEKHPRLRPASVALYRQIKRLLKPWLNRNLSEITFDMVDQKHKELAKEIGPTTANLAMRVLRIVWNYAADRSTLPECPVSRLKKRWFAEARRTRYVAFEQLPQFYRAVSVLESTTARDYILLLLFTGMRRREAAGLRWADIDLVQKVIRLPAEVTKAKRALVLPMSIFVYELLVRRRAAGTAGPFVFPGPGKVGHVTSADRPLHDVARDTGVEVSCHDLRRTFASVAADTPEVSWLALKLILNHTTRGDVTAGYVQVSTEQLRVAVQRVSDKLVELCGVTSIAEGNVARLR
jgi:integrase